MRRFCLASALTAITIGLVGCSSSGSVGTPSPQRTPGSGTAGGEPARGPSTAATLKVPPGHLPPPGQCKIWIPGRPPGHQARPQSCQGIAAHAPAGSWILYRPGKDKKVVHVRHVHEQRPGTIVRVVIFEAASGKFLREEKP